MIVVVVTYLHAYTIQDYLKTWGLSLRSRVTVLFYEDLVYLRVFPRGTYIFTDLERLSPVQRQNAEMIADYLAQAGLPVLNRPQSVLLRYDLLHALHASGVNRFRAVRLRDVDDSLRYPVFLRVENDHNGPVSELVQNARELQVAVLDAVYRGVAPHKLLAMEFCDIADDGGVYRKYSAFLIGDRFVTRHLLFSNDWVTKFVGNVSQKEVDEEREYLFQEPHPHAPQIRAIFRQASIEYGRIDYALLNGQMLVWEINTNPTITTPRNRLSPFRAESLKKIAANLRAAFEEIAESPASALGEGLPMTSALREAFGVAERDLWKQPLRRGSRPARVWLREMRTAVNRKI